MAATVLRRAPRLAALQLSLALIMAAVGLGCGWDRTLAERRLLDAKAEFDRIAAQAVSVAPDEARTVQNLISRGEGGLSEHDYASVITIAREVHSRTKSLTDSLPVLQERMQARWRGLSDIVPAMFSTLESELGSESAPLGLFGRLAMADARMDLREQGVKWADAQMAAQAGRLAEAVDTGEEVRARMAAVLAKIQRTP